MEGRRVIGEGVRYHAREPWFGEIAAGRKTVVARIGPLSRYQGLRGERAIFHGGARQARAAVVEVRHYESLEEFLAGEGWKRAAPHAGSLEAATAAYLEIRQGDGGRVFDPNRVRRAGGVSALVLRFA